MFARIVGQPLGVLVLAVLLTLGLVSSGQGQEQLSNEGLKKDWDATYSERLKLITGQRPYAVDTAQGKEDQKLMDVTSRWLVHRVTWKAINDAKPTAMAGYHDDLERYLTTPGLTAGYAKLNRAFVDQIGKNLAKNLKEVLTLNFADNRSAIINAALMLPPVARLKQEDIGDLLVELMNDKNRHNAVKHYAAKSMREFFPARMVTDDDDPKDKMVKIKLERDTHRLKALVDFIDRKGPVPTDEGEREAIRFLRRDAVISLAHAGIPALKALRKDTMVEGPAPAYELLRVLVKGKGAFDPPPAIAERVEAALGLCHLKNPNEVGYDPSVAVYAVGLCFVDYATEYSKDFVNIEGRKNLKPKDFKDSKIPTMAFRIQSERFKQAMKELVANSKGTPAQANAKKLEPELIRMADSIKSYEPVQQLTNFRNMVKTLAPKTGQLYKLKGPQIDPESLQGGPAPADGN